MVGTVDNGITQVKENLHTNFFVHKETFQVKIRIYNCMPIKIEADTGVMVSMVHIHGTGT